MEIKEYVVWFTNGSYDYQDVEVSALNADQALILAKAERINEGLDYTVSSVEEV
jgi:hypothetical protein